jgi:methionine-S-sulfoxide reductase
MNSAGSGKLGRQTLWILCVVAAARALAGEGFAMEEKATFAGGCFWCMQPEFDALGDAVSATTVGYTGGQEPDPSYEQVSSGGTGHVEAIQIDYDPQKVSYEKLLEIYWSNIDPTQSDGQFADHGTQYRTAIFYHSDEQKRMAEASKEKLERSGKFKSPIVTEIAPAGPFYPAQERHQKYYKKNPAHYNLYSEGSGRKPFIRKNWGDKRP